MLPATRYRLSLHHHPALVIRRRCTQFGSVEQDLACFGRCTIKFSFSRFCPTAGSVMRQRSSLAAPPSSSKSVGRWRGPHRGASALCEGCRDSETPYFKLRLCARLQGSHQLESRARAALWISTPPQVRAPVAPRRMEPLGRRTGIASEQHTLCLHIIPIWFRWNRRPLSVCVSASPSASRPGSLPRRIAGSAH